MFTASFGAVYDASVLYSATSRDLLMELATTGLFRARWSEDIHEEWIRAVLRNRQDLTRDRLERVRQLMDSHVPDCLVRGYRTLIPGLNLPDANDRHVLAVAIRAGAGVIVTNDLRHFPRELLAPFGIEAQTPDEFVLYLLDLNPELVCRAAQTLKSRWTRFSATRTEFLATLAHAGFDQASRELANLQGL